VPGAVDHNPREHEQKATGDKWGLERESGGHQLVAYDACYGGYDAVDERRASEDVGKS